MKLFFLHRQKIPKNCFSFIKSFSSFSDKSSQIRYGFTGMVGQTPLVRLEKVSEETRCNILAKVEFCNGGGSVKDRAALYLIKDAEKKGLLKPGGTVVEGTAGNTGIGLAHICLSLGYKCALFLPNTQSQEKFDMLKLLGVELFPVPAVALTDPNHYNQQNVQANYQLLEKKEQWMKARRYAESLENSVWTDQFDNLANRLAHLETTGPEIWRETNGKVDAVTFSTGTGGTFSGVSIYLKEQNPQIQSFVADPPGSVVYNWFKHGKLERSEGESITEGIGQGRITGNMQGAPVDDAFHVTDKETMEMVFRLLGEEGFFVGASSGLNVAAAVQAAKKLGPGHTIVTCLCDTGQRYYAKLFSEAELKKRGLYEFVPERYRHFLHSRI